MLTRRHGKRQQILGLTNPLASSSASDSSTQNPSAQHAGRLVGGGGPGGQGRESPFGTPRDLYATAPAGFSRPPSPGTRSESRWPPPPGSPLASPRSLHASYRPHAPSPFGTNLLLYVAYLSHHMLQSVSLRARVVPYSPSGNNVETENGVMLQHCAPRDFELRVRTCMSMQGVCTCCDWHSCPLASPQVDILLPISSKFSCMTKF